MNKRLPPQKAIREQCLICMGGRGAASDMPSKCTAKRCLLYPYRRGYGAGKPKKKLLRDYCLHCCGWELGEGRELDPNYSKTGGTAEAWREARYCEESCPFWHYKPGSPPGWVKKKAETDVAPSIDGPQSDESDGGVT